MDVEQTRDDDLAARIKGFRRVAHEVGLDGRNVATGDPLGRKTVLLVRNVDDFRLPAVSTFDLRLERRFAFGQSRLSLDVDVFNLFNAGTVLGRQYDARLEGVTGFGQVLEIMNPRIARLGVRYTF